jgi:periplasmic protein TonB
MFEDAQITGQQDAAKRIASTALSIVIHFIVVLMIMVIPLIIYSQLPEGELLTFLIAPPPPPPAAAAPTPPAAVSRPQTVSRTAVIDPNQFVAPTEIPKDIPPPMDDAPVIGVGNIVGGIPGGVPGGVAGGVPGGVVGGLMKSAPTTAAPPPPPPKPKREPIRVGGQLQESKLIKKVQPIYPPLAKTTRTTGVVVLVATVDEEGNVSDVQATSGPQLLQGAAKDAVRQWKYSPTILNGEPVSVTATVTVIFNLTQ